MHVLDDVDELIGLGLDFLSKAAEARRAGLQIGHADSVFIRHPQCHMASRLGREPIGLVVPSVIQSENLRKLVQIGVRILDVLVVGESSHSFDDERRRSCRKHLGDALQQGLRPAVYRNLRSGLRLLFVWDDALAVRRFDETRSEAGQISLHREPAASDRALVILAFERQPTGPGQGAKQYRTDHAFRRGGNLRHVEGHANTGGLLDRLEHLVSVGDPVAYRHLLRYRVFTM